MDMDMPVTVLLALSAVVGVIVLESRQMRALPLLAGTALVLFAAAMFVARAVEVAVGAVIAGGVLVVVLQWGVSKTLPRDEVPAFYGGMVGLGSALTLIAFIVVGLLTVLNVSGPGAVESAGHSGGAAASLLREVLVIAAAVAAVWAMLRRTGRRDE